MLISTGIPITDDLGWFGAGASNFVGAVALKVVHDDNITNELMMMMKYFIKHFFDHLWICKNRTKNKTSKSTD